jgi:tRNA pseudouridine synthase 10
MNVLAVARDAVASGSVCDACLGRLVADRSFGLTNEERGRSLRVALALVEDAPVADLEAAAPCWVCEGESERYDEWADRAVRALADVEFDTYQVGTIVPPLLAENDRLLREDVGLDADAGEPLKGQLNREVGKRVGRATDTEVDFERPEVQLTLDLATDDLDVRLNAAFVYGRYRKLERDVPQTKWPCNDCGGSGLQRGATCPGCDGSGFRYDESVEQLTAPVVRAAMDGESAVFHGAGREDVDARMLGPGRPFVIEVAEPRDRAVDAAALEAEINEFADGAVEVEGLRRVSHDMVARVKELDASKTYRMTVAFADPVSESALADALAALDGATIEQDTPDRVTHRRANITRTRAVYAADGALDGGHVPGCPHETAPDWAAAADEDRRATVEIHGAGGLYVKELISGDGDRTEPSLAGLLGVDAAVTALDVIDVTGEREAFCPPALVHDAETAE